MIKSVFVAVLDWGLGHATRCVSVIRELQNQNVRVVVGGSGPSLLFLKEEFKGLSFYELPSYDTKYPVKGSLAKSILFQVPSILKRISREYKVLNAIVEKEKIDYVISDNRYGCYSKKVKSVFIGHQLNLQMPTSMSFLSGFINKLHRKRIKHFDEIWIPDKPSGFKFSGELSKSSMRNTRYLGILSRFGSEVNSQSEKFDIVALVSGPEPQRTNFENLLREQLIQSTHKSILIKGKPGSNSKVVNGLLTEVDHLNSDELESIIKQAEVVVSRSGYSTIMDLAALGKKAIFIPTPGQTEQEYLANYLEQNRMAVFLKQNNFNLERMVSGMNSVSSLPLVKPNSKLKEAVQMLIENND